MYIDKIDSKDIIDSQAVTRYWFYNFLIARCINSTYLKVKIVDLHDCGHEVQS